jgi:hypothetical protein
MMAHHHTDMASHTESLWRAEVVHTATPSNSDQIGIGYSECRGSPLTTEVRAGYQFEEKVRGASPRDAPTLEWEGRERGLEEGVNEGAGRRLGVPTDGDLACVLF